MKKIIFIIDALSYLSYIKYCPHSGLDKLNHKRLLPTFSFEPDAAYLTGHKPEETDSGAHFWFDPDNSVFKSVQPLLNILPEKPLLLKKLNKKILLQLLLIGNKEKLKKTFGLVPFKLLPYFSFSEDKNIFDPNVTYPYPTIFNFLKKRNIKFKYLGVPFSNGKLADIKNKITNDFLINNDIFFFYISDLDDIGHKYGSDSTQYKEKLLEIFDFIKNIKLKFDKQKEINKFLVFGDHGMANINRAINIEKIVRKLPLTLKKDYFYFLDSTLARFWFNNSLSKNLILNAIQDNEYGKWITDEEKDKYYINYSHNKFGDAIWWASGGTLILPNFWQVNRMIKGMHGYRDDVEENHTMIIGDFEYESKSTYISMMEVHSILIDFLELEY